MSGIDHKAEALRLAEIADNSYGRIEHRNGADAVSQGVEALMIAAEAQVHATLYAADQQRIANLIALAQVEAEGGGTDRRTWDSVFETVSEGFSAVFSVRPEIREGLGLS